MAKRKRPKAGRLTAVERRLLLMRIEQLEEHCRRIVDLVVPFTADRPIRRGETIRVRVPTRYAVPPESICKPDRLIRTL
jgi:hypothetical protein